VIRNAVRVAWFVAGVSTIAAVGGALLAALSRGTALPQGMDAAPWGGFFVGTLAFTIAGLIVASRRPDNPVGWVLLAIGFVWNVAGLAGSYAVLALVDPGDLPGGVWAAWVWDYLHWPPGIALIPLLVLLFPTGRLLSRRWRAVVVLLSVSTVLLVIGLAFSPGPLTNYPELVNPAGISVLQGASEPMVALGELGIAASFLASVFAIVIRYRRSDLVERYQLRWFGFGSLLVVAAWAVSDILVAANLQVVDIGLLRLTPLVALPIATVIAITKYRLYDIDRLVSRTVTYTAVLAMLGLTYAGLVVAMRGLLPVEGDLPVAVSTLVVAVAFLPIARRTQRFVDRRFFRSRYDAAAVVSQMADELRGSLNVSEVVGTATRVVEDVLAPTTLKIWLEDLESDTAGNTPERPRNAAVAPN
jgi:hypothetical protein